MFKSHLQTLWKLQQTATHKKMSNCLSSCHTRKITEITCTLQLVDFVISVAEVAINKEHTYEFQYTHKNTFGLGLVAYSPSEIRFKTVTAVNGASASKRKLHCCRSQSGVIDGTAGLEVVFSVLPALLTHSHLNQSRLDQLRCKLSGAQTGMWTWSCAKLAQGRQDVFNPVPPSQIQPCGSQVEKWYSCFRTMRCLA